MWAEWDNPSNFSLRSSRIRVDLVWYESRTTAKRDQYNWMVQKMDGNLQVEYHYFGFIFLTRQGSAGNYNPVMTSYESVDDDC